MAGKSTAAILQNKLTEYGLARTLARHDVSPQLVRVMSVDDAARLLQRSMRPPGSASKAPKSAVKKSASGARPLKAKKGRSEPPKKARAAVKRQVQPNYWKRVQRELRILLCTNDQKYASLRKHIGKNSKATQVALVSAISGSIGAYMGVAAAVISPFVTLGLMTLLQVGKNAWCAGQSM
jgi:hypothetical protein